MYAKVLLHLTRPGAPSEHLLAFHEGREHAGWAELVTQVLEEIHAEHQARRKAIALSELAPLNRMIAELLRPTPDLLSRSDTRAKLLDELEASTEERYRLDPGEGLAVLTALGLPGSAERLRIRQEDEATRVAQEEEKTAIWEQERRDALLRAEQAKAEAAEREQLRQAEEQRQHDEDTERVRLKNETFLSTVERGEDELGPYVRFPSATKARRTITISPETLEVRVNPGPYGFIGAPYRLAEFSPRNFDAMFCRPLRKKAGVPEELVEVLALNGDPFDFRPGNLEVHLLPESERPKLAPPNAKTKPR